MFIDQIEEFKKNHLSDPFLNWISTLLFLPLAIYFRFIIGTSLISDKDFSTLSRSVWILGLVFFLWIVWKWLFDDRLIITGLERYLGLFYVVICFSTAFSANISLSLEKLISISTYLFSIYLLLDLKRSPKLWQAIINALLIAAGLSSLLILISAYPWINLYQLNLVQILADPTYLLEVIPRLPYSLGLHPSITAGYLVLILPLAVYQLFRSKNLFWKALQIAGLVLNISVLFLTQSRGGLIGLFFLVFVFVLIYWIEIWGFFLKNKIFGLLTISTLVLAGTAFIILIAKSRGFSLSDRTVQMRFNQWGIAYQIIKESPWLGSGLGTFGQKYLALRDPMFYPGTFIHAHNQLIQITTELGILGLITLLLIIWHGIRQLNKEEGGLSPSSKVSLIALGGLFGVLIPDAILTSTMIVLLVLVYLVWILPGEKHLPKLNKTSGLRLISLTAILLLFSFEWILWKIQPYDQALIAANQDDWQEASSALDSALERDPGNPYYLHALAFTEGQTACQSDGNVSPSVDYYQRSFDSYENWGIDHANAAVLYARVGDYRNAENQMEQAIQNFPQNTFFNCLLGNYYFNLNKTDDAIGSYEQCIAESPYFLDSPFWQEDKTRKELLPVVFSHVETNLSRRTDAQARILLAELYLAVDDFENAESIIQDYLAENPKDLTGNIIYIKILESKDELPSAKQRIEQLLLSNPRSPDLWIFKGKIALQEGNDKDAEAAFTLGFRLEPTSESSWFLGQYFQSQGDFLRTQDFFLYALNSTPSPMMDFSRRVAGRWPIQGEYLECMPVIRTYHGYFTPALNAAQGLEGQNCTLAACIYQGLIDINPNIKEAQIRLKALPCSGKFDANRCFNDLME